MGSNMSRPIPFVIGDRHFLRQCGKTVTHVYACMLVCGDFISADAWMLNKIVKHPFSYILKIDNNVQEGRRRTHMAAESGCCAAERGWVMFKFLYPSQCARKMRSGAACDSVLLECSETSCS